MWENITASDVEQAKHTLNLRRAETLSRHAREIGEIDADQSELEEFERVIDAFASKYKVGNGDAKPSDEVATAASEEGSAQPDQASDQPGTADVPTHVATSVNFNFNRAAA